MSIVREKRVLIDLTYTMFDDLEDIMRSIRFTCISKPKGEYELCRGTARAKVHTKFYMPIVEPDEVRYLLLINRIYERSN
jgi:hypothetical protein